ncbi:MAG: Bax inhibitor-1 family protein, partial [Streptococcus sp.]
MESNAIYTTSDAGLNRFFGKIYGLVGMGVGLSAVISYLMLGPFSHLFVNILMNYSWVYTAAIFVELALVFLASGAARKNTPAALPLFLVYSALNGFTLSFIIVQYTQATVFQAFIST